MKISEIIIEETPQGTISHNRPKVVSPLNKQARDAGQQLLNKAEQNTEQGPDKAEPSDETKFGKAMGTTITTGKIDPNLEQSGKNYSKELQKELDNALNPKAKATKQDIAQNRANR
jgi:SLT domain-containing protein